MSKQISSRHILLVNADLILVLGTAEYNGRSSPVLRARLEHAHGRASPG